MRKILNRGFGTVCLSVWLGMLPGQGGTAEPPLVVDGVAAMVNEEVITLSEVMMTLSAEGLGAGGVPSADAERMKALYRERLDELIDMRLILLEAEREKVQLPEWMLDQRISEIVSERYDGDRSRLLDDLAHRKMTYTEWRDRLREQMIVAALRQARVQAHVAVSPAQIREYFREHRAEFQQRAGTRVRIITLPVTDETSDESLEARAAALMAELEKGVSFAQAAREFSRDGMAEQGGDYGWIDPREDLRPELAEALDTLAPGEYSGWIQTPEEGYVVYKEAVRGEGTVAFEEVRDEIAEKLRQREYERLYRRWIERLRNKAHITIFDVP